MAGELLVYNALIWNDGLEDNSWMVFNQDTGYVIETGRDNPPVSIFPANQSINYEGRRVFPGFHEAHIHIGDLGAAIWSLNLAGCNSIESLQQKVKTCAEENPEESWIVGGCWEQDLLGRYPSREDIDAVCADRPVILFRRCIHIAVVNSKALAIAGITQNITCPKGGSIDRYPSNHRLAGHPTGILREDKTMDLVRNCIQKSSAEKIKHIKSALNTCLSHGVTCVHTNEAGAWAEYCQLADAGELPLRVYYVGYWRNKDLGNFPRCAGESRGPMLSTDRTKIFADGALGASTAALSVPYLGSTNKGLLLHSQADLEKQFKEATGRGFRLEVHVIGDAAVESVLDAMEAAMVTPEKRPILTHCQILREDLLERMRAQGVVANIQPQFTNRDPTWLDKRIVPELTKYSYAWKTMIDNGIVCAGSSDAPCEDPVPMTGIYDAIYRHVSKRGSNAKEQFRPEECLSVREAVNLYTKGGAYVTMQEHRLGQLQPGYQADFVVLQAAPVDPVQDPLTFAEAKVQEVWVAGKRRLCH